MVMSTERNHNDTELLSAYLDGQLTSEQRSALEVRLQNDGELRRQLALLRATVDLIKDLPQLTAPRDFTLTHAMVRVRAPNRVIYRFSLMSAAAAVLLLVVGFGLLTSRISSPAVEHAMRSMDTGEEIALLPTDTSLASPAPPLAPPTADDEQAEVSDVQLDAEAAVEQLPLAMPLPTGSPMPSIALVAPAMEAEDTAATTIELFGTSEEGRDRTTLEEASLLEAQESDLLQPTNMAGAGALAYQASPLPPATAIAPTTMLPSDTSLPTATHTSTQTPTVISTPVPPPTQAPDTGDMSIVLIIGAGVVLLGASIVAFVISRRR